MRERHRLCQSPGLDRREDRTEVRLSGARTYTRGEGERVSVASAEDGVDMQDAAHCVGEVSVVGADVQPLHLPGPRRYHPFTEKTPGCTYYTAPHQTDRYARYSNPASEGRT